MSELIYGVNDPRGKLIADSATAYVQEEMHDDGLYVVWDGQRKKFCVMDRKAPGGPNSAYVMLIQDEEGRGRMLDERDIKTLRKLRHHDVVAEELQRIHDEKERDIASKRRTFAEGASDDLKWFGKAVVPSVGWVARSLKREAIRSEATPKEAE